VGSSNARPRVMELGERVSGSVDERTEMRGISHGQGEEYVYCERAMILRMREKPLE